MSTIRFEEFDTACDGLANKWMVWKRKLNRYFAFKDFNLQAQNHNALPDNAKINELFLYGGHKLEQAYDEVGDEADTYDEVIARLDAIFNPEQNVEFNRFAFRTMEQNEEEKFDMFVSRLRASAERCNFANADDEIKSQIISNCLSDALKMDVLKTGGLDLNEVVRRGRLDESVNVQIQGFKSRTPVFSTKLAKPAKERQCHKCGYKWPHDNDRECPAKGKECRICKEKNHFAQMCPKKAGTSENKMVGSVQEGEEDGENILVWSVSKMKKLIFSLFMPSIVLYMCSCSVSLTWTQVAKPTLSMKYRGAR